jgi:4-amino-4-deoxy-L-arabinose transferase-like glycosyltransferase
MMLFQATTTQTDLLASFFFLSFILFALLIIQTEANFKTNFIFLALSLTLGILTKYHIAIFSAPIVIYLLIHLIKKNNNKNTIFAVLVSVLTIAVNLVPLFLRNVYFFGSITGKDLFDENATIVNSIISIQNMLSNNFKHIVDFISLPINGYNNLLFTLNHTLHNIISVSENMPGNNWAGEPFTINNYINEDTAGSIIHALLIILSLFLFFKSKHKTKLLLLFAYCFIAFSMYGLLFRYTPFDIRLLLPVLILLIIISTYIIYTSITNKFIINGMMFLFLILSIFPVYFSSYLLFSRALAEYRHFTRSSSFLGVLLCLICALAKTTATRAIRVKSNFLMSQK